MAKPEWGTKRQCLNCGTRFYDLGRNPVACPKCKTGLPPDETPRPESRRVEIPQAKPKPEPVVADDALDDEDDTVDDDGDGDEDSDDKSEADDFIEDASELGEDEDDMAEVLEASVEDESEER